MTTGATQDPQPSTASTRGQRLVAWLKGGGWRAAAGALVGSSALAAYSYFIGCRTGTCLLTSNVQTATLVGGVMGLVVGWPSPPRR